MPLPDLAQCDTLRMPTPARKRLRRVVARQSVAITLVAVAACGLSSCGDSGAFCDVTVHGPNAQAVIHSYLRSCGSSYSIWHGPFDADKATAGYASYANAVEYSLNVKNNDEGAVPVVIVGQRVAGGSWRTLGAPGTGP